MYRILLACGLGASSGFLAQNIRKAAKARNIEVSVKAISESDISSAISEYDVVMIGPHIAFKYLEVKEMIEGTNKKAVLIDKKDYGSLNGEAVLDAAIKELEG